MSEQVQLDNSDWLTTSQIIEKYGVTKKTVYRWSYEKKVITKIVDRVLYISGSSIDTMLAQQKEAKRKRALAFGEQNRKKPVEIVAFDRSEEVARLKDQVQDLLIEIGRLNGEVGANAKEIDRLHLLIRELVKK